jgi:hypothetical protein
MRAVTFALGVLFVLVALVLLLRWAEPHLIYLPLREIEATPAAVGLPFEEVQLVATDGTGLHGWYVPPDTPPAPHVLFLHGNAGNISHRLEKLTILREAGAGILIIDYRGYGRSGGRPTEEGLYRDARAAYTHLVRDRAIPPTQVVPYGESLGTGVAVDLAATAAVGGLVLEAVFTSIPDVAGELYRVLPIRAIVRSRFDSRSKIAAVRAPLLILHSRDDEYFGWHHAERLLAAAPGRKHLVELRGGHNDAFAVSGRAYREALTAFFASLDN